MQCVKPSSSPSPSPAKKIGDLNDDTHVDIFDFPLFVADFRVQNLRSDFNAKDGVDIFDFNIFIREIKRDNP